MSSVKFQTVRKWINEFDPTKRWIGYERNGPDKVTCIYCKICRKHENRIRALRNFSDSYIKGVTGTCLKKDNVEKHQRTDQHLKAIDLEFKPDCVNEIYKTTPIGKSLSHASDSEKSKTKKLFDLAYTLAKEEIAFKKFSSFVELEKRHGVALGSTYSNDISCKMFTCLIGEQLEKELMEELMKCKYFSIAIDGATDSAILEQELVYIIFVNSSGVVEFRFLTLLKIASGTSLGIYNEITNYFENINISGFHEKLVGFMSDGASVNFGKKKGVITLLQEKSPWTVGIHCLNHRLELAAKDAFKNSIFDEITDILISLFYYYQNSPKKLRELKELGEIMNETVQKPQKVNGTRWLQHKYNACKALKKSYAIIVAHLENSSEELTKSEDKAKVKGYLKKLKSFRFVVHVLFFADLLEPLGKLSRVMQGDNVDLLHAVANIRYLNIELDDLKETNSPALKDLLSLAENSADNVTYAGVLLSNVSASLAHFSSNKSCYIEKVKQCTIERFSNILEDRLFQSLKILDVDSWPSDLKNFGKEEIEYLVEHYRDLLLQNDVEIDMICSEWKEIKVYQQTVLASLNRHELWSMIVGKFRLKFPNISHLIEILLVIPTSNAKLERLFSCMSRVKSDWRNSLDNTTLCHLLRIKLEGPTTENFDPSEAVDAFFSTARHPNVLPYGPKRNQKGNDIDLKRKFSDVEDTDLPEASEDA